MTESTTTEAKAKRNFFAERAFDMAAMTITFTFQDGTVQTIKVADFPPDVQKQALLTGLGVRIGQNINKADDVASAVKAYENAVLQLMDGKWSAAPAANPATRLAVAYVQIAQEKNKVMTLKAAREQIAVKEKATPGFAASRMADVKFQSAYARAQAKSDTSLDDLD